MKHSTRFSLVLLSAATAFSIFAGTETARKALASDTSPMHAAKVKKSLSSRLEKSKEFGRLKLPTVMKRNTPGLQNALKVHSTVPALNSPVYTESSDVPVLNGIVVYSNEWSEYNPQSGLYQIPTASGQDFQKKWLFTSSELNYGAVEYNNIIGGFYYYDYGYYVNAGYRIFDAESGNQLSSGYLSNDKLCEVANTFAVDPTTDMIYGVTYNTELTKAGLAIYEFDSSGYTRTYVTDLQGIWNSIAIDKNGQMYGINDQGVLCKIDKRNGHIEQIGETGFIPAYLTESTIDKKSDRMFWTVSTAGATSYLCEVNKETGAATVLNTFANNEEVIGLYSPSPLAEDKAPAAPSNLRLNFPEGDMSGTIVFDAPETYFDGTAATGDLHYRIMVNSTEIATGTTAFGIKDVSTDYTATEPGMKRFSVALWNDEGYGPKIKASAFIGKGTPSIIPNASAAYMDGVMKITWPAVTTSSDGGYLNAEDVRYTVTRLTTPQNGVEISEIVAGNISETEYSETLVAPEDLTTYRYSITASYDGRTTAPTFTNKVMLGSVLPPYENNFNEDLGGFTILDANADESTWQWSDGDGGIACCKYHSSNDMDDWLFTLPFKLKKDYMYQISFEAWGSASFPERVEVKYGKASTPDAMTETLLEPTVLDQGYVPDSPFHLNIVPSSDGIYYIGFHGISDKDKYWLKLDEFKISEGLSTIGPKAVENLSVVPDNTGAMSVTISFTTPTQTIAGFDIDNIDKVEISRDGSVIKTFENPAVGEKIDYTDILENTGEYTYTVTAFREETEGLSSSATVYVGLDLPAKPTGVQMIETTVPGQVTLTWDAVTQDVRGKTIPDGDVRYIVARLNGSNWEIVKQDIEDLTYTFQATEGDEQKFLQCAVFAKSSAGNGKGQTTGMIPVGAPYDLIEESFTGGSTSYIWATSHISGGNVGIYFDNSFTDMESQDEDDGYLGIYGPYSDSGGSIISGKISLKDHNRPGLTFYTYNMVDGDITDTNKVIVSVKTENEDWANILDTTVEEIAGEGAGDGWYKCILPLDAYKDKTIQFRLTGLTEEFHYTLFDNIKVSELLDHDVEAQSIISPESVANGEDYTISFNVINQGLLEAEGYTVIVKADGKEVKTFEGMKTAPDAVASYVLEQTMGALVKNPVEYTAEILWDLDQNNANNKFAKAIVNVHESALPKVTDLSGEQTGEGEITLTWTAPDYSKGLYKPTTVDFEDGESFSDSYKDWTFIDMDKKPLGGFMNLNVPNLEPGTTTGSFWIYNVGNEYPDFNASFAPHSGDKFMASLFNMDGSTVNDWAISPEVVGGTTVSLWLRSYSAADPEKVRLCYSTGSLEPKDFVELTAINKVPGEWTEYTVTLPADAKHFAINSCSTYAFLLMVDDIILTLEDSERETLELTGYNVWRDNELISQSIVKDTKYVDRNIDEAEHVYLVTAVYDKGESSASNEVTLQVSGIDSIPTDMEEGVFYDTKGIKVEKSSLTPGIYLMRRGNKTLKVIVR